MTLKDFAKILAIFFVCFGGLALQQGFRQVGAGLFALSLPCLYCALRAREFHLSRETKAILIVLLGSAFFIGTDIVRHKIAPMTVLGVGGIWSLAATWLGRRNAPLYVPLGDLPKAVMRLPKLQGLALTMNRIGNVLCAIGIGICLYEWAR